MTNSQQQPNIVARGQPVNTNFNVAGGHPMIAAAKKQGSAFTSHVTTNKKSDSGLVVGINQPAVQPGGINQPAVQPGSPNMPVGPTVQPGGNIRVVGPGGQNPLAQAANKVVDSLVGRGSLGSNNVHVGQVTQNIASALNVAKQFNNTDLTTHLATAQLQMNLANSETGAARTQALQEAQNAMNNARTELQNMGYGGRSKLTFSMVPKNRRQ
jgi:hypothetical protein